MTLVSPQSEIQTLGIDDLISMDVPVREMVLDPILPAKGLMMIHAARGGSKTFLALAMGLAVAAGTSLLRWSAPKPRRVLYVDGEMTLADLRKRVTALKAGIGVDIRNDRFRLLTADRTDIPNLATDAGQRAIDPLLDGIDFLIIDNLSTLCWTGSDNDAGSWTAMQDWLLRLRRRGIAVLLVHHSGKGGQQRGTSRREDVLDTVIGLRRPEDYEPSEGARFEVHIEKSRAHVGDAGRPFEARLVPTPDGQGLMWSTRDLSPTHLEQAAALFRSGITEPSLPNSGSINRVPVAFANGPRRMVSSTPTKGPIRVVVTTGTTRSTRSCPMSQWLAFGTMGQDHRYRSTSLRSRSMRMARPPANYPMTPPSGVSPCKSPTPKR
jgi:putative DNA primase/helicase